MPLEIGSTIADLDESWPLGTDNINRGDDHIRLIKAVLKTQFPGGLGDGFALPILADENELNFLQGVTSNIQTQLTTNANAIASLALALSAPVGTRMVFFQAAAPTGWTQITTYTNHMMRIVGGAGGGAGGSQSPISVSFNHTHTTAAVALTEAQMPAHSHGIRMGSDINTVVSVNGFQAVSSSISAAGDGVLSTAGQIETKGSGATHSHGNTGQTNFSFNPYYMDFILCSKT